MSVLRSLRKEAGLTQQSLADSAGITQGFVSNVEKGRARLATPVVVRVAGVLAPILGRTTREVAGELVMASDTATLPTEPSVHCTKVPEAA